MRRLKNGASLGLCWLCGGVLGGAQVEWRQVSLLQQRGYSAMVYDDARGRMVLFGGAENGVLSDTWEWDGTRWEQRFVSTGPSARHSHAMAYDPLRRRVVLFGGGVATGGYDADTWEWDGTQWTQAAPATSPPGRYGHVMTYDLVRSRVVLFGGTGNGPVMPWLADTWEWDGASWTQLFPIQSPPAREFAAFCFDAAAARGILFGGAQAGRTALNDTWEWDGGTTTWTLRTPANAPSPRLSHGMTYESTRARILLFGGLPVYTGGQPLADTWEWTGSDWRLAAAATSPPAMKGHVLAHDGRRARTVLFFWETWEWDGSTWLRRQPQACPFARRGSAMAYDAARGVTVFVGSGAWTDTWEWDGVRWTERTPTVSPTGRGAYALAYDSARRRTVLFGGMDASNANVLLNDTWEWDGTRWMVRSPRTLPRVRNGHAMAYDERRQRVVLFGGADPTFLGDTWEWDGTDWRQRGVGGPVSGRWGHGMAYDAARGRVVLFGGNGSWQGDPLWEWDGTRWLARPTSQAPPWRYLHTMVYDSLRARTVVFGGFGRTSTELSDTWEWDGERWLQRLPATNPPGRVWTASAFDSRRGCMVMFGGLTSTGTGSDTWEYSPLHAASVTSFGNGCPGSTGTPQLTSECGRAPWIGEPYTVELRDIPAGAPALLLAGSSRTLWAGLPLPQTLAPLGMPGCTLWVSGQGMHPLLAGASGVAVALPIPSDPSLAGGALYLQALAVDRGANAAGVVVSNANEARIGAK